MSDAKVTLSKGFEEVREQAMWPAAARAYRWRKQKGRCPEMGAGLA